MLNHTLAILFLCLVVVAPLVWLARYTYHSAFTPPQMMLWLLAKVTARILWRASLPESLPVSGTEGAVIISNHRSSVDPFFIQTVADRPVHWMVAREYCVHWMFAWVLRTCEVIPVGRGGVDTAATKIAIRLASRGGLIGVLPEGRINMTDELMLPGRPGAVVVALKARVPIVPCYIEGSPYGGAAWTPFLMRARVRAVYGQPIDLSAYYDRGQEEGVVQELMLRCLAAIGQLAERPDFQPRLAGRRWKPTEEELRKQVATSFPRAR